MRKHNNKLLNTILCLALAFSFMFVNADKAKAYSAQVDEFWEWYDNQSYEVPFIVDMAGVLPDSERDDLQNRLLDISNKHMVLASMVIIDSDTDYSSLSCAEDIRDYGYYGGGTQGDCVMLYVNLYTRDWVISTKGYGIDSFTDAGIQYVGEQIAPYLKDADYYKAGCKFVEVFDDFMIRYENGDPFDVDDLPKAPFPVFKNILIAIAVGLVIGLIYILILKGQLKSVAPNESATDFVVKGSVNINEKKDIYLYRTVSKTPKQSSSSGGSSTHTSSSGSRSGGGGGKF